jgi:hypothetical protein
MRTRILSLFDNRIGIAGLVIARSASDEAIHASASGEMDCFAHARNDVEEADPHPRYFSVIASPLKSTLAISPTC